MSFCLSKSLDLRYSDGSKMADTVTTCINKLHVILMIRSIPQNEDCKAVMENLRDLMKDKVAQIVIEWAMELEYTKIIWIMDPFL